VHIRHQEAQPTECAIMVAEASARPPRFTEDGRSGQGGFDELHWTGINGGEWGELQADLGHPVTGEVDIYLLSRSKTENHHFCWAFFRGVRMVCGAEAPPA
jgi:hypothetical protein